MEKVQMCVRCLAIKDLSCFGRTNKKEAEKPRHDRTCKECRSRIDKQRRVTDPEWRNKRIMETKQWRAKNPNMVKQARQDLKMYTATKYYEYFREHPCAHCGEKDPLKLEIDHIEPLHNRRAKAERSSWFQLLRDLPNDCGLQVLCANCHAVKTHKENNTSRWQIAQLYDAYDEEKESSGS